MHHNTESGFHQFGFTSQLLQPRGIALLMVFIMLTAAYWRLGLGDAVVGNRCVVVSIPT